MPKIVDPDQRRRHIVDAVERLIVRSGVESASLRNVADEAGLNVGSVRHYVDSQEAMLVAAYGSLVEGFTRRLEATIVAAATSGADPFAQVMEVLGQTLPLDEERRREVVIYFAFAEASRTIVSLQPHTHDLVEGLRYVCSQSLEHLGVPEDGRRAIALASLIDGLAFSMIHAPDLTSPEDALALVRDHLQGLLSSRGSRRRSTTRPPSRETR